MGNFEEVKKILDECVDDFYRETHPIDDIALQICQLFEPKPDGSKELEMAKMAWRDFLHAHADECDVDAVVDLIVATTASIRDAEFAKVLGDSVKAWHERLKEKDAECQERVERIQGWIDKTFTKEITLDQMMATNTWQEFWEREGVK